MDPNENQDNTTRTIINLSVRGIIEDDLPGEPVNEVLRDQPPVHGESEEAVKSVVEQVRRIARDLENDTALQQSINAAFPVVSKDVFWKIVGKVIEDDITWERIIVLLCIAGKIIAKMIKARLRQSLPNILVWTWDFFQSRILSWIEQQGGWASYLSSFSTPTVQYMTIFTIWAICGFLFGAFVFWRARRPS